MKAVLKIRSGGVKNSSRLASQRSRFELLGKEETLPNVERSSPRRGRATALGNPPFCERKRI
jgi:hypothetical protein